MIDIVPILQAGFGNRMFQISAAVWLAETMTQNGLPSQLKLYQKFIKRDPHDTSLDIFDVLHLPDALSTAVPKPYVTMVGGNYAELCDLSRKKFANGTTILLKGYFQDHRYTPALRSYAMKYIASLERHDRWFLHVRKYTSKSIFTTFNFHNVDLSEYYEECQKRIMCRDVLDQSFDIEVFSNDAGSVPHVLRDFTLSYRSADTSSLNSSETFARMVSSSGGIISNSTFSWWAARFMQWKTPSATVLMPNPWIRMNHVSRFISNFNSIVQPMNTLKCETFECVSNEKSASRLYESEKQIIVATILSSIVLFCWYFRR